MSCFFEGVGGRDDGLGALGEWEELHNLLLLVLLDKFARRADFGFVWLWSRGEETCKRVFLFSTKRLWGDRVMNIIYIYMIVTLQRRVDDLRWVRT